MSEALWYLLPIGGALGAAGSLPLFAWIRVARRRPCPHCGRRSRRVLAAHRVGAARVRPVALTYQCRSCDGMMRYARRPTGEEFWERAQPPPDSDLANGNTSHDGG